MKRNDLRDERDKRMEETDDYRCDICGRGGFALDEMVIPDETEMGVLVPMGGKNAEDETIRYKVELTVEEQLDDLGMICETCEWNVLHNAVTAAGRWLERHKPQEMRVDHA